MAIDPTLRTKIEAELMLGEKAKDLSEKYDISYTTIQTWANKLKTKREDIAVDEVVEIDPVTLEAVKLEAAEKLPPLEAKKIEKAVSGIEGLQRLNEKSQAIAFTIYSKLEEELKGEADIKLLRDAANIVSVLHNAFNGKNTTQVNVLNNNSVNVSSEKLEMFKGSLGV